MLTARTISSSLMASRNSTRVNRSSRHVVARNAVNSRRLNRPMTNESTPPPLPDGQTAPTPSPKAVVLDVTTTETTSEGRALTPEEQFSFGEANCRTCYGSGRIRYDLRNPATNLWDKYVTPCGCAREQLRRKHPDVVIDPITRTPHWPPGVK